MITRIINAVRNVGAAIGSIFERRPQGRAFATLEEPSQEITSLPNSESQEAIDPLVQLELLRARALQDPNHRQHIFDRVVPVPPSGIVQSKESLFIETPEGLVEGTVNTRVVTPSGDIGLFEDLKTVSLIGSKGERAPDFDKVRCNGCQNYAAAIFRREIDYYGEKKTFCLNCLKKVQRNYNTWVDQDLKRQSKQLKGKAPQTEDNEP